MPYTPSGGYYERKPVGNRPSTKKLRSQLMSPRPMSMFDTRPHAHILGAGPISRARRQVVRNPVGKTGKYAVLICFDTPQQAKAVHREILAYCRYIRADKIDLALGDAVMNQIIEARSVALHDCQKHPLNVKY